jgi:hypothetical protein
MNEHVTHKFDLAALAKAGGAVGVILYVLCALFYWMFYGGQGQWMIRSFMPGLSTGVVGLLIGLAWSLIYGAGVPWLLGFFYNRWAR